MLLESQPAVAGMSSLGMPEQFWSSRVTYSYLYEVNKHSDRHLEVTRLRPIGSVALITDAQGNELAKKDKARIDESTVWEECAVSVQTTVLLVNGGK